MANLNVDFVNVDPERLEDVISELRWRNKPQEYYVKTGEGLYVFPKAYSDFWCRTYQRPPADRSSGHALLYRAPSAFQCCSMVTKFYFSPVLQYDHAGLIVFVDEKHWLKAGIELVDGICQMSCVVTNGESDFNCFEWNTPSDVNHCKVKISLWRYEHFCECKVEYEHDGQWKFVRQAPVSLGKHDASIDLGLMCCAPQKEGNNETKAVFHNLKVECD